MKMGELFSKMLRTSQDRVNKGKSNTSKPIEEVQIDDTPNGLQIARTYSSIFGGTLLGNGKGYSIELRS